MEYPIISRMLRTIFNSEDGLSEDVATRMYVRAVASEGSEDALKSELRMAFSDANLSWLELLSNDEFEVYCAEDEQDARQHAERILWLPIFGGRR